MIIFELKNIFEKKKFEKIRFVVYSRKASFMCRFLKEDGKKKVAKKKRIFCHCNLIKFNIEPKVLVFPIVQIVNIFTKILKK